MKKIKIYALNGGVNSIFFFRQAFEQGAAAVQCDIRRTLDGQFIAFRDRTLSSMCSRDWVVHGTSWAHIKNLPVKGGQPIPHLDDILKFMVLHPTARFFFRTMLSSARDITDLSHQIRKAGIQNRAFITVPYNRINLAASAKRAVEGIGTAVFTSFPAGLAQKAINMGIDKICVLPGSFPGSSMIIRIFESLGNMAEQADAAFNAGVELSIGAVNGPNTLRRAINSGAAAVWAYDVPSISKLIS